MSDNLEMKITLLENRIRKLEEKLYGDDPGTTISTYATQLLMRIYLCPVFDYEKKWVDLVNHKLVKPYQRVLDLTSDKEASTQELFKCYATECIRYLKNTAEDTILKEAAEKKENPTQHLTKDLFKASIDRSEKNIEILVANISLGYLPLNLPDIF